MPEGDIDKEAEEVYNQIIDEMILDIDRKIPNPPTGPIRANKNAIDQNADKHPVQHNEPKKDVEKDSPVPFHKDKISEMLGKIDSNNEKLKNSGINQPQDQKTQEAIGNIRSVLKDSPNEKQVNLTKDTVRFAIKENRKLLNQIENNKELGKSSPGPEKKQNVTPKSPAGQEQKQNPAKDTFQAGRPRQDNAPKLGTVTKPHTPSQQGMQAQPKQSPTAGAKQGNIASPQQGQQSVVNR